MNVSLKNRVQNKSILVKKGMDKVIKSKWFGYGILMLQICFLSVAFSTKIGFALADYNTLVTFVTTWTTRVGGLIAFVGAVIAALGWRNDDPGEMSKGLKTAVAGLAVIGLSQAGQSWMV